MNTSIENVLTRNQLDHERYEAYNLYESVWQDETTFVAESLRAPLCKELVFQLRDGELYSSQGQRLAAIFDNSISTYDSLRKIDPRAEFQYQRSCYEKEELRLMEAMASGETPTNTMVIFSTYPEELEGATEDYLGYQHKRRMGFIRVVRRNTDGTVSMWTQSFDGHYKPGIEAMYQTLGASVDWTNDPLTQRVMIDLDDDQKELLRDQLLYAYDRSLHEAYGGNWFAGRSQMDEKEAISFVESQSDLVRAHVEAVLHLQQDKQSLDVQRYNFVMAMRQRYDGVVQDSISVEYEMSEAGAIGRENGETVSACGVTITAGEDSIESDLAESGYNIPTLFEGQELIDYCMTCPVCKRQQGIKVQKVKGSIHYTCLNSMCNASTLPATETGKTDRISSRDSKELTTSEHGPKTRKQPEQNIDQLVKEIYSVYAELNSSVGFGGRVYTITDRRNGSVIDSSYDLRRLGLKTND